jgi:hypothetical protein
MHHRGLRDIYDWRDQSGEEARRRIVDERTLLLLVEGIWYRVEVGVLPKERIAETVIDGKPHRRTLAEPRYDVVQRKTVSRVVPADARQCEQLYGSSDLYALSKRQISSREIKARQLRWPAEDRRCLSVRRATFTEPWTVLLAFDEPGRPNEPRLR